MSGGASSVEAFKGPYKGGSGQEMNFELLGMAPSAVFGLACRGHQGPGDASGIRLQAGTPWSVAAEHCAESPGVRGSGFWCFMTVP